MNPLLVQLDKVLKRLKVTLNKGWPKALQGALANLFDYNGRSFALKA